MLRVVIDTNVFISAFYLPESRPGEVVRWARRRKVRNVISPEILKEIERILKEKLWWDDARTQSAIRQIEDFSEIVSPKQHLHVIGDDPDNRILECALEARAKVIISGDRHLLTLGNYQGIEIMTPAQFWESFQ
ncbi:MAG: putative toxin-antitoxin system toxin component, PIN family [Deltaproteobacteria bacterium]|nr:putative toxin-antitoxin system toxin component, PIN family [Deltaproteobacteria bacterium]